MRIEDLYSRLPYMNWSSLGGADFWRVPQNLLNLYFYLAIVALPCTFIWVFFAEQRDDKRLDEALRWCFKVCVLIIPGSLIGIYFIVNGYQAITRALRG